MQAEDVKFMFSEMMQRSEQIYLRYNMHWKKIHTLISVIVWEYSENADLLFFVFFYFLQQFANNIIQYNTLHYLLII